MSDGLIWDKDSLCHITFTLKCDQIHVDLFIFKVWEYGIPLCKELADVYEKKYEYRKLSNILASIIKYKIQSNILESIINKKYERII